METRKMTLDFANIKATRVLGGGALGTVFLVTTADDPLHPFALKVITNSTSDSTTHRRIQCETTILSHLSHPFLPRLLTPHLLTTPELTAYALPFCPGGDLNALRHIQPDHVFSLPSLRFYAAEILSALDHLHTHLNVVYRDLKPENVLIQPSGHIALSDFDLSCQLRHSSKSHSFVGTEEYIAPEVVKGEGHDRGVDFWALGVLVYEMAYGRTPFKGRSRKETFRNVVERDVEFRGRADEGKLKDLVWRLLVKDVDGRLGRTGGAQEVMEHEFFAGVKWEMIAQVDRPPYIPSTEEENFRGGFDIREYFEAERKKKKKKKTTVMMMMMMEEEEEEEVESTVTSDTSVSFTEF